MSSGTAHKQSKQSKAAANTANTPTLPDAIGALEADHREVEAMFEKFARARSSASKRQIADDLCRSLTVHEQIEEELFYPACKSVGVAQQLLDDAAVEHEAAWELILQIVDGDPEDDLWEAKVRVLREQVEHHVGEEEGPNGLFAQARRGGLDLDSLGEALAARRSELMA